MSLQSVSALAELTGLDRRTVLKRLETLAPMVKGRATMYNSQAALPLIFGAEGSSGYDLNEQRARLNYHQANIEELKEQKLRGELMPADSVVALMSRAIAAARAQLLAAHNTIRNRHPDIPIHVIEDIQEIHSDALRALSQARADSEGQE